MIVSASSQLHGGSTAGPTHAAVKPSPSSLRGYHGFSGVRIGSPHTAGGFPPVFAQMRTQRVERAAELAAARSTLPNDEETCSAQWVFSSWLSRTTRSNNSFEFLMRYW